MSRVSRFLGDRYELVDLLANGGMGQVWRARDLALGRPVAVKILLPEHAGDTAAATRFQREARLSAGLTHPNIAAVHDFGQARLEPGGERVAYLVMELIDGEPLSALLRREERLTPGRTLKIVRQTAAGLSTAHASGVVHRDVKPGNLLIDSDARVKIADFGIAWSRWSDPLTDTGMVMGTAQYLSPEQANGAGASPASDIYSLGLVAYECLAGRRVFHASSAVEVALMHANRAPDPLPSDVPGDVQTLLSRMLAKDPRKRFADGAALLGAVDELIAGRLAAPERGRPAPIDPPTPVDQVQPVSHRARRGDAPQRRRHAAVGRRSSGQLVIALLAVLAVVAVVTFVLLGG